MENLWNKPDDLDPQPEFPLRTKLTFYKEEVPVATLEMLEGDILPEGAQQALSQNDAPAIPAVDQPSPFPPATILGSLWIIGLIVWCMVYMNPSASGSSSESRSRRKSDKKSFKDV